MDNLPEIVKEISDLSRWLERHANMDAHAEITEQKLHDLIHAAAQAVYFINRDRK